MSTRYITIEQNRRLEIGNSVGQSPRLFIGSRDDETIKPPLSKCPHQLFLMR